MQNIAKRRGAGFQVLVHNRLRESQSFHHPTFDEYTRQPEVTNITEYLRTPGNPDPVGYDGSHWSPEGHRRVAAFLKEKLSYQDTAH